MTAEEEVVQLRKENQELREALQQTQELLRVALARIEELEKQKTPPPAFVKANTKKKAAEEKRCARSVMPSTIMRVCDLSPPRLWSIASSGVQTAICTWEGSV